MRYQLELKYGVILLLLSTMLMLVGQLEELKGIHAAVDTFFDQMLALDVLGGFWLALVGNATLVIQVPYTLPMLSAAFYSHDTLKVVALSIGTGVGAGIGATISYSLAHRITAKIDGLSRTTTYLLMEKTISKYPASIPILIFIIVATPIPDMLIILPLAMTAYPARRVFLPLLTAKVAHCIVLALIAHYSADTLSGMISNGVRVEFALLLLVGFVLLMAYQVEKGRWAAARNISQPPVNLAAFEV